MSKAKKVIIGLVIASVVGGSAIIGLPDKKSEYDKLKEEKCTGVEVQYEETINGEKGFICGSNAYMTALKAQAINRLKNNEMKSGEESDFAVMAIIAKNDKDFRKKAIDEVAKKYDPIKKKFDGSMFDMGIREQLGLYVFMVNEEYCKSGCQLTGSTLDERIYNLIK